VRTLGVAFLGEISKSVEEDMKIKLCRIRTYLKTTLIVAGWSLLLLPARSGSTVI